MAICEDIVSDVFASLWDKRNSIELKKDTATAYLKICVRNSCLNYLKHLEYEWNYNELCQKQPPVYATESDSVYTLNELYDMLFKALERLPQNYRIVFTKNFFEGKTHAEIAEELNLSVKSINRYKQKQWICSEKSSKNTCPYCYTSSSYKKKCSLLYKNGYKPYFQQFVAITINLNQLFISL